MKRLDIKKMPEYFERYINQVEDIELSEALDKSLKQLEQLDPAWLDSLNEPLLAKGKWSINTTLLHISDSERILAYRALRAGRNDHTIQPGFDQDILADNSNADSRAIKSILSELISVRRATISMFDGFDNDALNIIGKVWTTEMPVFAMGLNIIGHQIHHFRLLEEVNAN
jgi:hypothetical protein